MTTQVFWNGLAMLGAWAIVLNRLVHVLRRQPQLSPAAKRHVWFFWGALVGFAIVVTLYHPLTQKLLDMSGWFYRVPQAVLAITVYVVGAQICYGFAPVIRPRWNWPLYVGIGVISLYIFLSWATQTWPIVRPLVADNDALPCLVFSSFLLVLVCQIVLPAYAWAWRQEHQKPMRLRLQWIAVMHWLIVAWLLIRSGEAMASVLGEVVDFSTVYIALGVLITILFAAHFVPPSFFVRLTQWLDYPADVLTYFYICRVATLAERLAVWNSSSAHWRDVLSDPAKTIYQRVVSILDAHKSLKRHAHPTADVISAHLDAFVAEQLNYDEIVMRLRELGRTQPYPALQL